MRLLDLYCGEGGCSAGYVAAGFEVVGVDLHPKPRYPYEFVQADALEYFAEHGHKFDAVHASPPCKSENPLRVLHDVDHPDLLTPTLAAFADLRMPWVVENVSATDKLPGALMLCGAAFGLGARCADGIYRPLKRHRLFQSNVFLMGPPCSCGTRQPVGVYGEGGGGQMTRGYKGTRAERLEAMGTPWMSAVGVSQAIPPAYTEFIGEQLLRVLT